MRGDGIELVFRIVGTDDVGSGVVLIKIIRAVRGTDDGFTDSLSIDGGSIPSPLTLPCADVPRAKRAMTREKCSE